MTLGERIQARIEAEGISQSELARRAGVPQTTINSLIRGQRRSTPHLVRLARALATSPAFLAGETDDPDQDAPPPPPVPTVQFLTLPVALPSEAALTRMFEGLLAASPRLHGAELAHELATRLPRALAAAGGPLIAPARDQLDDEPEPAEAPASDHREPQRASRT